MILPLKSIDQLQKKKEKLYLKTIIEQDQGKERAAIKIMYLFFKLTIHKVPVN